MGTFVAFMAARAAGGQCGAVEVDHVRTASDPICGQLVRTLSTRVGLASAVATTIILLTMAGLAKLAATRPAWAPPRSRRS
ncbi:MAG: hypothetical protein ABR518_08925 [Actinomycetota bacterium]